MDGRHRPRRPTASSAPRAGLKTTADGVDGLLPHVEADGVQIAFDATTAYVHAENSRKLNELGVLMIDLTPAAIGPYCVPPVNLARTSARRAMNVNMVTCGGQATIPMVAAVSRVQPVAYAEIVATVSRRSAGPGTRKNIDEFTRTTAGAVETRGRREEGQGDHHPQPGRAAADHARHRPLPDRGRAGPRARSPRRSTQMIERGAEVRARLPAGNGPVFDGKRVSVFLEVEGLGDYLPKYAGNLDIMTAAAARTAEMFADEMLAAQLRSKPLPPSKERRLMNLQGKSVTSPRHDACATACTRSATRSRSSR